MKFDVKAVPKWGWVAIAVGMVAVFWYVKHRGGNTAATAAGPGADPSQLSSDIAAQLAAALGGSPASTDPNAVGGSDNNAMLAELLAQQGQSLQDFLANISAMSAAGIGYGSGGYYADPSGQSPGSSFGIGGLQPPNPYAPPGSPYAGFVGTPGYTTPYGGTGGGIVPGTYSIFTGPQGQYMPGNYVPQVGSPGAPAAPTPGKPVYV